MDFLSQCHNSLLLFLHGFSEHSDDIHCAEALPIGGGDQLWHIFGDKAYVGRMLGVRFIAELDRAEVGEGLQGFGAGQLDNLLLQCARGALGEGAGNGEIAIAVQGHHIAMQLREEIHPVEDSGNIPKGLILHRQP